MAWDAHQFLMQDLESDATLAYGIVIESRHNYRDSPHSEQDSHLLRWSQLTLECIEGFQVNLYMRLG